MGKTIEDAANEGGTFIEGSTLDLRSLLPMLWNDQPSFAFGATIFEAMIDVNPETLDPVGNLAEGWEISTDGMNWTMYLRDGVTWHDGEPFTANDVKFSFDYYLNGDVGGSQTSSFQQKIDSVNVIDDLTAEVVTKIAVPDFLADLGAYALIAEHIWKDLDPKTAAQDPGATGQDAARVVGTGPFIFKEWVTGDHATSVKNENYWDGVPHLDEYVFKIVPDDAAAIAQLKTGEIDWYVGVPGTQVSQFDGSDVKVVDYPQLSFTFYGTQLDTTHSTKFQDVRVRYALLYALDRQSFVDNIYNGYADVAVGTMPPLSWAFNPDGIKEKFEFDLDKANSLLDEAGWVDADGDGIRENGDQKLEFDMWTISGNEIFGNLVQAYQESWTQIGVKMTPQLEDFQSFVSRVTQTFDFETFLIGFGWGATPDQSAMWACNSYGTGFNIVKYCNPKVDDLENQALVEFDRDKRIQLYTDFQNLLLEDLPMVATEFGRGIDAYGNRVHNLYPAYTSRYNLETLWIEK